MRAASQRPFENRITIPVVISAAEIREQIRLGSIGGSFSYPALSEGKPPAATDDEQKWRSRQNGLTPFSFSCP